VALVQANQVDGGKKLKNLRLPGAGRKPRIFLADEEEHLNFDSKLVKYYWYIPTYNCILYTLQLCHALGSISMIACLGLCRPNDWVNIFSR